MPRPRTNKKAVYPLLTATDIALLDREKTRRNAPSLSAVFEAALLDLLRRADLKEGLWLPATTTPRLARCYKIAPETVRLLEEAAARFGYATRDVMRAALGQLGRAESSPLVDEAHEPLPVESPAASER